MGTDNFSEFMTLFLLLKFSLCCRYDTLKVYGDSRPVINHVFGNVQLHYVNLRPLADHVHEFTGLFVQIEFCHIFMEFNQTIAKISKECTMLYTNQIILLEFDDGKALICSQLMLQDF